MHLPPAADPHLRRRLVPHHNECVACCAGLPRLACKGKHGANFAQAVGRWRHGGKQQEACASEPRCEGGWCARLPSTPPVKAPAGTEMLQGVLCAASWTVTSNSWKAPRTSGGPTAVTRHSDRSSAPSVNACTTAFTATCSAQQGSELGRHISWQQPRGKAGPWADMRAHELTPPLPEGCAAKSMTASQSQPAGPRPSTLPSLPAR